MDGKDLTCGTCLSLYFDFKWYSARIEAEAGNYFAIVFDDSKKPYRTSMDFACRGSFISNKDL